MITVQELLEYSKQQAILHSEHEAKKELSAVKKQIAEGIAKKVQEREERFGRIINGNIVEVADQKYEVLKVESSYVSVINESGEISRKWLNEIKVIGHNSDNKIIVNEDGQISYKGYTTKSLSKEMVESLSAKKSFNRFLLMTFLQNYDLMNEEHDVNKLQRLVEQVMSHAVKLQVRYDKVISEMDDQMILEAAQGNIHYNTPCVSKIKDILATLEVNKYEDNSIIQNLQAMIRS